MRRRPLLEALALSPLASAFAACSQTRQQGRPAAGKTLFANVYRPGLTVAISGPF